jgi:hypothetical protein
MMTCADWTVPNSWNVAIPKQPGVDEREALAKLSEMQAAIQAQQAQHNTALVDGELQSLGSAMSAATALEGAGRALQETKLEKAAQELEKIEDPQLAHTRQSLGKHRW